MGKVTKEMAKAQILRITKCPMCNGTKELREQKNLGGLSFIWRRPCPKCNARGRIGVTQCAPDQPFTNPKDE